MERLNWTSFIMLSSILALVIQLLIINSVMAQAPNPSLAYNPNTSRIVDVKNHTITIIDKKTHQPISVCKFTPIEAANMTTNNTVTTNIANTTTCENLTPVKPTINENLTVNTKNATTNETLTPNTANATTNEILTPENATTNETLTKNAGNATTSVNLTAKFNELTGK